MLERVVGALILGWLLVAFGLFVVAYTRLVRQALRMPDRKWAFKKLFNFKPYATPGWPDHAPEAKVVAIGAVMGTVFFVGLLIILPLYKCAR